MVVVVQYDKAAAFPAVAVAQIDSVSDNLDEVGRFALQFEFARLHTGEVNVATGQPGVSEMEGRSPAQLSKV